MVRPSRSAAIQSPFGTATPEVVPFQVKTTSRLKSTVAEIGELAVVGRQHPDVLELELLGASVTQPWPKLSQARTSTPRAPEQRPHAISMAPVSDAGTMPMR